MSYLEVKDLYKKWDSVTVDFSFSAQKNDFVCIVGSSGSGKSSVLRMIAGLLKCDDKEQKCPPHIILAGRDITNLPPASRGVGMVFQNGSLFLHMSVEDNIAYGLCAKGMGKKESRKEAGLLLKKFGLEGFAKRYPHTLSGGEAQRVALARSLVVKPDLLLFDEPLSALDAPLRKKLGQELLAMQREYAFTAVMVTHDLEEAKALATKIIIMDKGKKFWEGSPSDFTMTLPN